jgi:2'-5' RNA ligase
MRLFVAVTPPAEICRELDRVVHPLRRPNDHLRWTRSTDWHITLAFFGDVPEVKLSDLRRRLARAAQRHPPLQLSLAGAGRFADRALWVGVRGDVTGLGRLAASASAAGRRIGIPGEARSFRPHLTLARARSGADPLVGLASALADYAGSSWTATEFQLVHSVTGPRPEYRTEARWPLEGAPPVHRTSLVP